MGSAETHTNPQFGGKTQAKRRFCNLVIQPKLKGFITNTEGIPRYLPSAPPNLFTIILHPALSLPWEAHLYKLYQCLSCPLLSSWVCLMKTLGRRSGSKLNEARLFISLSPSLSVCLELDRFLNQRQPSLQDSLSESLLRAFSFLFRPGSSNIFADTSTQVCGFCSIFYGFLISHPYLYK